MGNCLSTSDPSHEDVSKKLPKALPVDAAFKFPSPLPNFTRGLYYHRFLLISLSLCLPISFDNLDFTCIIR